VTGAWRLFDFSIGAVLTQGIHGPDGGWDPAKDGELQDQADNPCDRSANGEGGEPGEDKGNQQAHGPDKRLKFLFADVSRVLPCCGHSAPLRSYIFSVLYALGQISNNR
jgi:hypothetical protein